MHHNKVQQIGARKKMKKNYVVDIWEALKHKKSYMCFLIENRSYNPFLMVGYIIFGLYIVYKYV